MATVSNLAVSSHRQWPKTDKPLQGPKSTLPVRAKAATSETLVSGGPGGWRRHGGGTTKPLDAASVTLSTQASRTRASLPDTMCDFACSC